MPSKARLEPRLVTPEDVESGLRGGENASRQIVEVIASSFPADKLVVFEVYTPGGNWSSYPPHKHDVHQPPVEVDLDEIYYYRMRDGRGFALQNLYRSDRSRESLVKVHDGDVVLVRDGYHPVVAGPWLRHLLPQLPGRNITLHDGDRRPRARLAPLHLEANRSAPAAGTRLKHFGGREPQIPRLRSDDKGGGVPLRAIPGTPRVPQVSL